MIEEAKAALGSTAGRATTGPPGRFAPSRPSGWPNGCRGSRPPRCPISPLSGGLGSAVGGGAARRDRDARRRQLPRSDDPLLDGADAEQLHRGGGPAHHLGYSLPLALGAKAARPDATVLHAPGDAAFGQCGMDLETAVRNKIGTVTVLLNNSCMGGYDKHIPIATERYAPASCPATTPRWQRGWGPTPKGWRSRPRSFPRRSAPAGRRRWPPRAPGDHHQGDPVFSK